MMLTVGLVCMSPVFAQLEIAFTEPNWQFLLENRPLGETQAKLSSAENNFARKIQPLLAKKQYTLIEKAFSERKLDNDSPALKLLRGQVEISLEQYKDAETSLKAAIKEMPDLALAHSSLSMLYMLKSDYINAQKHLSKSLHLGLVSAQVYGQLAYIHLQLEQPVSAIAGYRIALLLSPEVQQWKEGLLYALVQSQSWGQAKGLLENLIEEGPNNANLWLQRAHIAIQQDNYRIALSSLEAAFALGDNNIENKVNAAKLHLEHGSVHRAIAILNNNMEGLLSSSEANSPDIVYQVATWLVRMDNWQQLAILISQMERYEVKFSPELKSKLNVLAAELKLSQGKDLQAQKKLALAIEQNPANGEALLAMADLMKNNNNLIHASLYYQRAEGLLPYRERSRLNHAQLAIEQQDYKRALELLRQVKTDNPERYDLNVNIRSLEKLVLIK